MNQKKTEIKIPDRIAVYEEPRTKVKSIGIPFTFPDGINGLITLTQLSRGQFFPADKIESVTINFKP